MVKIGTLAHLFIDILGVITT